MARPSKFTPDVRQKIVNAVRGGNGRETSARVAGISEATLYGWLDRGRREKSGQFNEFYEAVQKAEAEAEVEAVLRIRQASIGGQVVSRKTTTRTNRAGETVTRVDETYSRPEWQAAAWLLERKYPGRWGRRERLEVEHVLREQAERLAKEEGLDAEEIMAEVERLLEGD
jgi:transposase